MARAGRRAQALEALAFEREREQALRSEVEQLVLELDGPRVDELAFARLSAADVELVREALGEPDEPFDDDDELGEHDPGLGGELDRLRDEIERCRSRQGALERYVAALDGVPASP
jgi:hypothetical protein